MRAILNISMPLAEKQKIEKRAKKAGQSISGYILGAVKLQESLIQEDELVEMIKQAEKEHESGKTKKFVSLKDLM